MAETLLFALLPLAVNEDPAVSVHWYQSVDGLSWGDVAVDTAAIATLAYDNAKGKYIFPSTIADPAKYSQLKTESADGIFSPFGAIVPPRPTGADICTIQVDVVSFGVQPKEGIAFTLESKTKALHGFVIDSAQEKILTTGGGRVTFNVMRGGIYELTSTVIGKPVQIDTAGLAFINVADLIERT